MQPFTLVIFGITSNLAQKYLLPALYDLENKGKLHPQTQIIGVARSPKEEGWIQEHLHQALHKENLHHQHQIKDQVQQLLFQKLHYLDGHLDDPSFYSKLKAKLNKLGSQNIIFYLATYPDLYSHIFQNLKQNSLHRSGGWVRLMIEKPFGQDLKSAQHLNRQLKQYFSEDQVYRLDHYLGKQTLREISKVDLDHSQIDHLQVSALESYGVGERGGYYDLVGALVDVGQNHLLQMLAAVLIPQPSRAERTKILQSLQPLTDKVIFGQYQGYTQEKNIPDNSQTETFFALKTYLNTGRLKDVPIYLRAGKKLAQTQTEVVVVYKNNPKPYRINFQNQTIDPYENLIMDTVQADQTFFNSAEEVEAEWAFIDPLIKSKTKTLIYQPGSFGPEAADELITADGRSWVNENRFDIL